MPTIPQYVSDRNPTQEPGAAPRSSQKAVVYSDPSIAKNPAAEQLSEQLIAFGEKMRQVENANADSKSQIQIMQARIAFEDEFRKNPEPSLDDYPKWSKAVKEESLKVYKDPRARENASRAYDLSDLGFRANMQKIQWEKQVDASRVNTEGDVALQVENAYEVPADQLDEVKFRIKKTIFDQVDVGVYEKAEGQKLYDKALEDIRTGRPRNAIYNDMSTQEEDSDVLKALKSPKEFPDLTHDERISLVKESQQRIFNNNQRLKRDVEVNQRGRNTDILNKLASGTLTLGDIENEYKIPEDQGGIPRKTLVSYQKGIINGVAYSLNEMMEEKVSSESGADLTLRAKLVGRYNKLIDLYIDDKTDIWKAKEALAAAWKDGVLDPSEAQFLDTLHKDLKDIEFNRSRGKIVSAIKGIKKFLGAQPNATDEDLAVNIKQLLGGAAKGQDPEILTREILSDNMKVYFPDYASYPKEGKIKHDKTNGHYFKVFPDGTWSWVTEPKKSEK